MMGGYPTFERSVDVANTLIDGGADIIEIGIPFSDPIADGPIIQSAAKTSLENGMTLRKVLRLCKKVRQKHSTPIVLMGYLNPIYQMGYKHFFEEANACEVDGVIVPDLSLEESGAFRAIARENEIDVVMLTTPSTSPDRLGRIASHTSGFLYLVSVYGVTGPRRKISNNSLRYIRSAVRIVSNRIPLCVGFGLSRTEQIKQITRTGVDGVVVGSYLISELSKSMHSRDSLRRLEAATRHLKKATILPQ
jgi:tryptophan synthase alpha chain